jgi:hypothetical protein
MKSLSIGVPPRFILTTIIAATRKNFRICAPFRPSDPSFHVAGEKHGPAVVRSLSRSGILPIPIGRITGQGRPVPASLLKNDAIREPNRHAMAEDAPFGRPDMDMKQCPSCGEEVKAVARVCRHCRSDLEASVHDREGTFVAVRLRVKEKTYGGNVFVPAHMRRLSDVLNDRRRFIILTSAVEETGYRDLPIGFLAVNKDQVDSIEMKEGADQLLAEGESRILSWK